MLVDAWEHAARAHDVIFIRLLLISCNIFLVTKLLVILFDNMLLHCFSVLTIWESELYVTWSPKIALQTFSKCKFLEGLKTRKSETFRLKLLWTTFVIKVGIEGKWPLLVIITIFLVNTISSVFHFEGCPRLLYSSLSISMKETEIDVRQMQKFETSISVVLWQKKKNIPNCELLGGTKLRVPPYSLTATL